MGRVETIANIADGCGAFLVPFGVLYSGPHHPDTMVLQHCDFVCFNYKMGEIPSIVAWFNDQAVDEYYRCDKAGCDTFRTMDLDRFTEHAADNFTAFLRALKDSPTEFESLSS